MPEISQRPSSRAALRVERMTTSCGECRRRKQKCDQRQPCGNCARRFPQPLCEYRPTKRAPTSTTPVVPAFEDHYRVENGLDHQPLPSICDTLLNVSQPSWAKRIDSDFALWSGTDLSTTYPAKSPSLASNEDGEIPLARYPTVTGAAGTCDNSCQRHSAAIHDALKLLVHHYSDPDHYLSRHPPGLWHPANIKDLLVWNVRPDTGIVWPTDSGASDDLRHLSVAATRPNSELLRIWQKHSHAPFPILSVADLLRTDLKLLCRFKASIDGNLDPESPLIRHYAAHCIQDPMLLQIILYTSACFLNETGHVPRTVMMAHKGEAIRMLNEHLMSDVSLTSDLAIAGVVQLVTDEWYWGETQDLRAHLRGLREMIRVRGGLSQLGMSGFLAKTAITHDIAIALAHEAGPFFQHGTEFDFTDPVAVPFKIAHNTPLVRDLPPFADCARSLGMHPATATILDDMRFLFAAVLTLPRDPTPQQLQKVQTTCEWVHDRLLALHPVSPGSRQASPPESSCIELERPESSVHGDHVEMLAAGGRNTSSVGLMPDSNAHIPGWCTSLTPEIPTRGRGAGRGDYQSDSRHPDHLYQVVRHSALLYSRAIMKREPLSTTCLPAEFLAIWVAMWRVPLTAWKSANGVFYWALLAIAPCCHGKADARLVKSMLIISALGLGLDNWAVAVEAARAGLRVQRWLSQEAAWTPSSPATTAYGEGGGGGSSHGQEDRVPGGGRGGEAVERHGYHQSDCLRKGREVTKPL